MQHDYSQTPVRIDRRWIGGFKDVYEVVVPLVDGGPHGNEIAVEHGISAPFVAVEMFGAYNTEKGDHRPIPYVKSTSSGEPMDDLSLRLDATHLYLSSEGDWTAHTGSVTIRFYYV